MIGTPKKEREGIIYISGSGQLVRGLLVDNLVDELHMFVDPVALGEGRSSVPRGRGPRVWRCRHTRRMTTAPCLGYGSE